MKKNRMMRLAAILFVCVMLTTSVISGTFAKYTSTFSAQDSARVAKWGFDKATLTFDLFDATYVNVNGNGDNVIAPGTTKTAKFTFVPADAAAPEVAYKIVVDTTGSSIHPNIKANKNIVWQLDDGEFGDWDALLAAIAGLSEDNVAPNEYPTKFTAGTEHTITWKWIFDETTDAGFANNDVNDTNMGNTAVDTDQEVVLVINILAEQVD